MLTKELQSASVDVALTRNLRVLVVKTRWNANIVDALRDGCVKTLKTRYGLDDAASGQKSITLATVSGAFELPFACRSLLRQSIDQKTPFDAVIAIGVLIKGSTMHFEYICESVSHALMQTGLDMGIPVIFGVLTCLTEEQACQRAAMAGIGKNEGHNHGIDWAAAAVEMALLNRGHVFTD